MEVPMAEEIKFTEKELQDLNGIQQKVSELLIKFGQHELQRINLDNSKKTLEAEYADLLTQQAQLASSLNDKYGPGVVDPTTGIFIPNKQQ
jgi:hypothetical protein